ncbi:MAG: hypothetical protein KGZ60_10025 [Truepera sp.]|nr:hypothetical protein [Truepera sp.]
MISLSLAQAPAGVDPQAAVLLERAREAHGGEALRTLRTLRDVSVLTFLDPVGQPVGEMRAVSLIDLENGRLRVAFSEGDELTFIQQLKPDEGFTWTPQTGVLNLPAAQRRGLRQTFYLSYYGLRFGGENREAAELLSETTFLGMTGKAVRVTTNGFTTIYLFDADGRLLAESFWSDQLGEVNVVYEDYREVGELVLPFRLRQYVGEMLLAKIEVQALEPNVEITDADFVLP